MNTKLSIICVLAALLFSGCAKEPVSPDTPVVPDTPTAGRHLRLSGSAGNDNAATRASWADNNDRNLTFAWDYSDPAATESDMKMAFTKRDGSYLETTEGNLVTDARILRHTDAEKQDDAHFAIFETIGTYNPEWPDDVFDGYTVHAVTPINTANSSTAEVVIDDEGKGTFITTLYMPTRFTQSGINDLSHLSNYTYMYTNAVLDNCTASLFFEHLTAYVRFKVYNWRGEPATIYGVKLAVIDFEDNPCSASGVQVTYNPSTYSLDYRLANEVTDIQVDITDGSIDTDGSIFLYAPVFPQGIFDPFFDKLLRFTIIAQDPTGAAEEGEYEYFTYELESTAFKNVTGSYDWKRGNLYTFHLYLDDVLRVPEVTVNDWNEQDISGGEAVEWVNGFSETGDYEPAQKNADGYYEINNGGNLFWFANHVNTADRTANAVLTANIDLEGRPWTPIGETDEAKNNFRGVFDGQNYTIRGLNVEGGRDGLGFFGEVRTGTVRNFTIYGEVVVNTEVDYVGGVIGSICGLNGENDLERNGAVIQNITSYVNLTAKVHGPGMIGGFVGYANHQSLIEKCSWYGTFDAGEYRVDSGAGGFIGKIQENSSEVTIRNCAAYGTIKTNYAKNSFNNTPTIYMGGFLSFSNTGAQTTLENCLFAGKFERGANLTDEARLGAFGTLRSVNAIKNCYYLADDGLEAVHSDSNLKPGSDNVEITAVTEDDLRNNTIATQLGTLWEQGENYPVIRR